MNDIDAMRRRLLLGVTATLCSVAGCRAAPAPRSSARLVVLLSGGFAAAFEAIAPRYGRGVGIEIDVRRGPSMGDSPTALPARLARREEADIAIMAREPLERLAAAGVVDPSSLTDLADSRIALAVREGATVPDISSVAALRSALLAANSVAYSDSASGVYVSQELYRRLGIEAQLVPKSRMIVATPVGELVARGEAELGFQQLSELKPVRGVRIAGLLPDAVQKVTTFSAAVVAYSERRSAAMALIAHLASPAARTAVIASGLDPARHR